MAVITGANYRSLSEELTNARLVQLQTQEELYDAVEVIVATNVVDVEVDLLFQFWQTYQITLTESNVKSHFLSAISVLNQHVIDRATDSGGDIYVDINEWLRDESVQVPETYAEMSEQAGWPIDHDRISTDPVIVISYT